jgi:hypothetical protein
MPQIFHPSTNIYARGSILVVLFLVAVGGAAVLEFPRTKHYTGQGVAPEQPVPFSHQHHVAGLGIDCRYCHTSVENAAFAGIPPTKTCMNCHKQIWTNAPMLEPVRASFRDNKPLVWSRVHDLPDFAYFNHSIHVAKGVGCATCHGQVDRMPLMYQQNSLQMEWCLDCHREPEKNLRPKEEVFNMAYEQPTKDKPVTVGDKKFTSQMELGKWLRSEYKIRDTIDITSCYTCHR